MSAKAHANHHRPIAPSRALQARLSVLTPGVGGYTSTSTSSLTSCTTFSDTASTSRSNSQSEDRNDSASSRFPVSNGNHDKDDHLDWDKLVKVCKVMILYKHPRYVEVQAILKALSSVRGHLQDPHLRKLERYALDALPYAKYTPSPVLSPKSAKRTKSTTPKDSPPRSYSTSSAGSPLLRTQQTMASSSVSSLNLDKAKTSPANSRAGAPLQPADNGDGISKVLQAFAITTPAPAVRAGSSIVISRKSSPRTGGTADLPTRTIETKRQTAPSQLKRSASSMSSLSSASSFSSRRSSETISSDSSSSSSDESTASLDSPQMKKMYAVIEKLRKQARDVLLMYQNEILG